MVHQSNEAAKVYACIDFTEHARVAWIVIKPDGIPSSPRTVLELGAIVRSALHYSPLFLFALCALPLNGQDIGQQIGVLTVQNAQGFVGPLARGVSHALTAGFVSSADPHGMLGFDIGVQLVGARFAETDETFDVVLPTTATYQSKTYSNPYAASDNGRSPTVAGEGSGVVLSPTGTFRSDLILTGSNPDDFDIQFPEGMDLPGAPFAALEGSLGIGFGTQIMARIIPATDVGKIVGVDKIGDVSAFGFSVMHSLTQWLPIPTPFWDMSVVAGTQKLELGNYAAARGTTLGLVAGAGLGPLSVYAHGSAYQASVDLDYTVSNPRDNPGLPADGTHLEFTEKMKRTQRLAVGAQLDLILLKFSAEYGTGDYNTLSVRASFGFR